MSNFKKAIIYTIGFISAIAFLYGFAVLAAPSQGTGNITRDLTPETDSLYNIGSNTNRYLNGYFDNLSSTSATTTDRHYIGSYLDIATTSTDLFNLAVGGDGFFRDNLAFGDVISAPTAYTSGIRMYSKNSGGNDSNDTVALLHNDDITSPSTYTNDAFNNTITVSTSVSAPQQVSTQKKFGNGSAFFDSASSQYLQLDNATSTFGVSEDFLMEGWVYPSSNGETRPLFVAGDGTSANYMTVRINANSTITFQLKQGNANKFTINTGAIVDYDHWQLIRIEKLDSTYYLYWDGILEGTGSYASDVNSLTTWRIGANTSLGGTDYFDGYIDEVFIYFNSDRSATGDDFTPTTIPYDTSSPFVILPDNTEIPLSGAAGNVSTGSFWAKDNIGDLLYQVNGVNRFLIPEQGTGYATNNFRSFILSGTYQSAGSESDARSCSSNGFNLIDCDTSGTGADLGVQDDAQILGNVYSGGYASSTGGLFTQGNLHVGSNVVIDGNSTTTGSTYLSDNESFWGSSDYSYGLKMDTFNVAGSDFPLLSFNNSNALGASQKVGAVNAGLYVVEPIDSSTALDLPNITFSNQGGTDTAAITYSTTTDGLFLNGATSFSFEGAYITPNGSSTHALSFDNNGAFQYGSCTACNTGIFNVKPTQYQHNLGLNVAEILPFIGSGGLIIDNSGNVGIGTSAPTEDLTLGGTIGGISMDTSDGSDTAQLALGGGGTATSNPRARGAWMQLFGNENANTGQLILHAGNVSGGDILFNTADTQERMRITNGGNVGIGTSTMHSFGGVTPVVNIEGTSWAGLSVKSTGTNTDPQIYLADKDNNYWMMVLDESDSDKLQWRYNGSAKATLDTSGNLGVGVTAPAGRLDVFDNTTGVPTLKVTGTNGTGFGTAEIYYGGATRPADVTFYTLGLFANGSAGGFNSVYINSGNTTGQSRILFGDVDDSDLSRIVHDNSSNDLSFWTNNSQRVTITSAGALGVGDATPDGIFQAGGTTNYATISAGGDLTFVSGGDYLVGGNDYAFRYANNQDFGLYFNQTTAGYDFLTSGGAIVVKLGATTGIDSYFLNDVGIGLSNPLTDLHVYDSGAPALIAIENTGNGNYSGVAYYRERLSGTGSIGACHFVTSDTSTNESTWILNVDSAAGCSPTPGVQQQFYFSSTGTAYFDNITTLGVNTTTPAYSLVVDSGSNSVIVIDDAQGVEANVPSGLGTFDRTLATATNQCTVEGGGVEDATCNIASFVYSDAINDFWVSWTATESGTNNDCEVFLATSSISSSAIAGTLQHDITDGSGTCTTNTSGTRYCHLAGMGALTKGTTYYINGHCSSGGAGGDDISISSITIKRN